jgi:long-chain fatty acid transport protein
VRREPSVVLKFIAAGLVLTGMLLSGASEATAGGFQSRELPARSMGMAGVLVALPNDATAMYVNPAALSFLEKTNLTLGTSIVLPDFRFVGVAPSQTSYKMKTQVMFPPNMCLAHTFANGVGVGISVTNPYSTKTDWGEEWAGSRIVTSSEIRSVQVTPTAAIRIGEKWSLGLGVQIVSLRMDLNRRLGEMPSNDGTIPMVFMTGSADITYGFEIGVMYSPGDFLTAGLSLKSRTLSSIDQGTVTYSGSPGESSIAAYSNTTFSSSVTLPDQVRAGVSLRPLSSLLLAGEVGLGRWSTFKNHLVRIGSTDVVQRVEQAGWRDAITLRAGVEFSLGDIMFRGGLAYEESPVPGSELRPSVPDANLMAYSAGIGYEVDGGLVLDLGVQLLGYKTRTVTDSRVAYFEGNPFNGTYDLSGTVVGLNVCYSWK